MFVTRHVLQTYYSKLYDLKISLLNRHFHPTSDFHFSDNPTLDVNESAMNYKTKNKLSENKIYVV